MNDSPKYIPFPLFLVSSLPDNLNQIFNYGIYNFSKSISFPDLHTVYSQVIYEYYRGKLPTELLNTIEDLVEQNLFVPDEDYSGFSSDGSEFNPQDGVDELFAAGESDNEFKNFSIQFWQIKQALGLLKITADIGSIFKIVALISDEIEARVSLYGGDASVMMTIPMMFDYYKNHKSLYEIDLLRGFLAIKSILGKKPLTATTKRAIAMRMIGAKNDKVLHDLLKNEKLKALYDKYLHRYHIDKLLDELVGRGFITSKLGYNRRIFLSTALTIEQLPEAISQMLLKNNSKVKRDKNTNLEKLARQKLSALIKAG